MGTEGVTLDFTADAIDAIADIAVEVNANVENIGARRLQTVMERVLDEISFAAPDRSGETVKIDAAYVREDIGDLAKNADLSRFILCWCEPAPLPSPLWGRVGAHLRAGVGVGVVGKVRSTNGCGRVDP